MATTSGPGRIGLVNISHLAPALRRAGYTVYGDEGDFRSAVAAVKAAAENAANDPFPIVARHPRAAGFIPWVTLTSRTRPVAVVISDQPDEAIPNVPTVGFTGSLDDLLSVVGKDPIGGDDGRLPLQEGAPRAAAPAAPPVVMSGVAPTPLVPSGLPLAPPPPPTSSPVQPPPPAPVVNGRDADVGADEDDEEEGDDLFHSPAQPAPWAPGPQLDDIPDDDDDEVASATVGQAASFSDAATVSPQPEQAAAGSDDEDDPWDQPPAPVISPPAVVTPASPAADEDDPWDQPVPPVQDPAPTLPPGSSAADETDDPWGDQGGSAPIASSPSPAAPFASSPSSPTPEPEHYPSQPPTPPVVIPPPPPPPPPVMPSPAVIAPPPPPPAAEPTEVQQTGYTPPTPVTAPPAGHTPAGYDDLFTTGRMTTSDGVSMNAAVMRAHQDAPLLFSMGAKGGVGKSTMSLMIAQTYALLSPESTVVLIDGSRGQADIRNMVGLPASGVTSIWDVAHGLEVEHAIMRPDSLNALRQQRGLPPLNIYVLPGPAAGQSSPSIVTSAIYEKAISQARKLADFVVVDTQIIEDTDTSRLVDQVFLPMAVSGAFVMCTVDSSPAGISNTQKMLEMFRARHIPAERLLLVLNRLKIRFQPQALQRVFSTSATIIGGITDVNDIFNAVTSGQVHRPHEQMVPVLADIITRVTGQQLDLGVLEASSRPALGGGSKAVAKKRKLFGRAR